MHVCVCVCECITAYERTFNNTRLSAEPERGSKVVFAVPQWSYKLQCPTDDTDHSVPLMIQTTVFHWGYRLKCLTEVTDCSASLRIQTAVSHWGYRPQCPTEDTDCSVPLRIQSAVSHWGYRLQCPADTDCSVPLRIQTAVSHWGYRLQCPTGDTHCSVPLRIQIKDTGCSVLLRIQTTVPHWGYRLQCPTEDTDVQIHNIKCVWFWPNPCLYSHDCLIFKKHTHKKEEVFVIPVGSRVQLSPLFVKNVEHLVCMLCKTIWMWRCYAAAAVGG